MSHAAENSKHYRYNPYEVAVFGAADKNRKALADALFERLCETRHAAQVLGGGRMARGSEPGPDGGMWSGTLSNLLTRAQLLEADIVIYEASEWPEANTVVVEAEDSGLDLEDRVMIMFEELAARSERVPVYGLLLAGGYSRRMHRDKAALKIHEEPQLHHAYKLLDAACDRAFVSARADQADSELFQELPRIVDRVTNIGPLGGILSAQMEYPEVAWMVMACDLPLVSTAVLEHLTAARNPTRLATAFRSSRDGLPEPLCAIYEPKSRMRILNFLATGVHCPRKILIESRTWLLDLEDPFALDNMNTPEDLESARIHLAEMEEVDA